MDLSKEQQIKLNIYKRMPYFIQVRNLNNMLKTLTSNPNSNISEIEAKQLLFQNSNPNTKIQEIEFFIDTSIQKRESTSNYSIDVDSEERSENSTSQNYSLEIQEYVKNLSIEQQEKLIKSTKNKTCTVASLINPELQDRYFEKILYSGDFNPSILNHTIIQKHKKDILIFVADKNTSTYDAANILYQIWEFLSSQERTEYYGYIVEANNHVLVKTWADIDEQCQQKYMPAIIEEYNSSQFKLEIWAKTKSSVQEKYLIDFINVLKGSKDENLFFKSNNFIEFWEKTKDSVQNSSLGKQFIESVLAKIKDHETYTLLYKSSSSELQNNILANNIKKNHDLPVEKKSDHTLLLCSILRSTKDSVFDMNFQDIFSELKENTDRLNDFLTSCPDEILEKNSSFIFAYLETNIDGNHKELIINSANYLNIDLCLSLLKKIVFKNNEDEAYHNIPTISYDRFFTSIKYENRKAIYQKLVSDPTLKNLSNKFYNLIVFESLDEAKAFLSIGLGYQDTKQNHTALSIFEKIYMLNNNVTSTINFDFIKSDLAKSLTEEQLIRITHYPEVQAKLVKYINNRNFINAFLSLLKTSENWTLVADNILKNIESGKFDDLLSDLKTHELSPEYYDNLCIALSKPNNCNISCIEDIEQYFSINGKRNSFLLSAMKNADNNESKKEFISQYLYGMNLEELKKYESKFKGILELDVEKNEYIKQLIIKIQQLNSATTEDLDRIICDILEGNLLPTEYIKDLHLESKAINLFTKSIENGVYQPQKNSHDLIQPLDYNGKKINVYRIHHDFKMLARVEGAYNRSFSSVMDYRKFYDNPDISAHGNCESIIGQDQIGLARNTSGNIVVGYSFLPPNSVLVSAPYDLGSKNISLAPLHDDNLRFPVKFHGLQETIDNTRHSHNETVMERLIIDEHGVVQKLKPNYLIWVEDRKTDKFPPEFIKPSDSSKIEKYNVRIHLWEETQKAAVQLGIPIVVINREECAEKEMAKINEMQCMIRGEIELPKNKSIMDIVKEAIIKFENNYIGLLYADSDLQSQFFTQDQRKHLISTIISAIENMPGKSNMQKQAYLHQLSVILKQELSKFEDGFLKTVRGYNLKTYYEEQIELLEAQLSVAYPEKSRESKVSSEEFSIESKIGIEDSEKSEAITNHAQSKAKIYSNLGEQIPLSSIIECSKDLALLLDKAQAVQSKNHSRSKVHGVQHVKNVLLLSNYIGMMSGISSEDLDIIREAAIYHDNSHERPGDPSHARIGADWYLKNVNSNLNKNEVAFLIEAHESKSRQEFIELALRRFPQYTDQRRAELVQCAIILQDADRLDILRYDIENPTGQRFDIKKLNNSENSKLVSAVIELNTRQSIKTGYLQIKDGQVQRAERKFSRGKIKSEIDQLSSETTVSGFSKMAKNIEEPVKSELDKNFKDTYN